MDVVSHLNSPTMQDWRDRRVFSEPRLSCYPLVLGTIFSHTYAQGQFVYHSRTWAILGMCMHAELSTGRMDPRVGSARVTILPDVGG